MNSNEYIRLLKENAGLRLGYEKYKRKYRLLHRFCRKRLFLHIEGLKTQKGSLLFRLRDSKYQDERDFLKAEIEFVGKELKELRELYDTLIEIDQ